MGLFSFFGSKKEEDQIWTLDLYIDRICSAMKDQKRSPAETGKYLSKLGHEVRDTYGVIGIKHAWRAACLTTDSEDLLLALRREWKDIDGWEDKHSVK